MNTWFTADTHFGHTNITGPTVSRWKSGYRNFSSVQEMNNTIIKNINDCVKEEDTLYHLGDWCFGGKDNIMTLRNSIVCKNIHLITGNHDEHIEEDIEEYKKYFLSIRDSFKGYIGKTYFHLDHCAHRVWYKSHKGSIHLYGHSHGSIPDFGKSMDVGIDCHKEFRPFHINEILQIMSKREVSKVDHHGDL